MGLALAVFWLLQKNGNSSAPTILSKISSLSLFGDFFETPNQLNGVDWTLRLEIIFYSCCAIWLLFRNHMVRNFGTSNWKRRMIYVSLLFLLLNLPIFPRTLFLGYVSIFCFIFLAGIWIALYDLKKVGFHETLFVVISTFIAHNYTLGNVRPDLYGFGAFSLYGYLAFILLFLLRHRLQTHKIMVQLSNLTYLIYLFHNWLLDKFYVWFQLIPIKNAGEIPFISRMVSLVIFLCSMWLIHNYFEKRIIEFSKKKSSRRKDDK